MKSTLIVTFCLLLLTACASPVVHPFLPRTERAKLTDDVYVAGDGAKLALRSWVPRRKAEAVIVALHGFNDYSKAFDGAGEFFRAQGIATYAYDQRGFGANEEGVGIWGGIDNLTADVAQLVELLKDKHPNTPIYLLGESMGGAVVINTMVQEDAPEVDGIILSAPAVWGDETMNGFYRMTLWLLAHTMPSEALTGEDLDIVASDNWQMLMDMAYDPLVIKKTRIDAIYGIVGLMDEAYQNIDKVQVPTLFLYGANDQIIPRPPVAQALEKLEAPYTLAYYPDGYHMLLRDLKGEMVLFDITSWIDNRYTPLPSGYDMGWREEFAALFKAISEQKKQQN